MKEEGCARGSNAVLPTIGAGFLHETNEWNLVTDTGAGTIIVEHRWSYVDPFGRGETDSGMSIASVEEFLMGHGDYDAKQKLSAFLKAAAIKL
jgi:hypothetical protein